MYIIGDLQDTPGNSKVFYYRSCKISKHPYGIAKTCEYLGLQCTIYQHWDTMDKPIISRHGLKGGRFLDGMYNVKHGLSYILGSTIVQDTGILSDHDMFISKFDLGIKKLEINCKKEECFDFRHIMSILVSIKPGQDHPSLNENVHKGTEFKMQAELYHRIQKTIYDQNLCLTDHVEKVIDQLMNFEQQINIRTMETIHPLEQGKGKLIQRLPADAILINNLSKSFFAILNDVRCKVQLASMVHTIPVAAIQV